MFKEEQKIFRLTPKKLLVSKKQIIQKLRNSKLLNINMLQPPETYIYMRVSGGYSMLMFKSFVLHNF